MPLAGGYDIVTAHPAARCAAVANIGVLFHKRYAFSRFPTRRIKPKPDGIFRGGNGFYPFYRLVYILYDLIHAHYHNDLTWSVNDAGNSVGITVHIVKLSVLRHGV